MDTEKLNEAWEQAYRDCPGDTLWQDEPTPFLKTALTALRSRRATSVLDLGCGDGRNLAALAEAGLDVAGADVSVTALERARRRLESRGMSVRYIHSDAVSLAVDDSSVDAVTCFDVFSHLTEPGKALTEIARVLRPGGIFIANVFNVADSEYGLGEPLSGNSYYYRNAVFHFYEEEELRALFGGWTTLDFRTEDWVDPPHGDFRPYEHTHSNFLVIAAPDGAGVQPA